MKKDFAKILEQIRNIEKKGELKVKNKEAEVALYLETLKTNLEADLVKLQGSLNERLDDALSKEIETIDIAFSQKSMNVQNKIQSVENLETKKMKQLEKEAVLVMLKTN